MARFVFTDKALAKANELADTILADRWMSKPILKIVDILGKESTSAIVVTNQIVDFGLARNWDMANIPGKMTAGELSMLKWVVETRLAGGK